MSAEPRALPPIVEGRWSLSRWLLALACGCALLAGAGMAAADDLGLTAGTSVLPVTPGLAVYRDPGAAMTFEQARQAFRAGRFQPSQRPWPSCGFTSDAVWVRFAVRDESGAARLWLTELRTARMGELDWYLLRGNGGLEHLAAGNLRERPPEMVDCKNPVFPFQLAAGESAEVFLRVHSETAVHLPLQIWEPKAFASAQAGNEAAFAAFFGYLAALILMSLVFSLFTRDRGYVLYSLSLLGVFGIYFIVSGYYLWLHLPGGRFAVQGGAILTIEYTMLLMMAYLRYFIDLPASMPGLNRWGGRLAWCLVPATVIFLLGPYHIMYPLVTLQLLLFGVGSLTVSVLAWWRGNRVARFYTLAWLSFWILFAITQLQYRAWLPMLILPELQAILGVALGVTLFFLAMADRVRQVRRNMEQARIQVLGLEQQALREFQLQMQSQQRLIRDLHDGLGANSANIELLAERGLREKQPDGKEASLKQISRIALENSLEVRSLMDSLDSGGISWSELLEKVRSRAALVFDPAGVTWEIAVSGELPEADLPALAGLSLLRLLREGSNNIFKHSFTRSVSFRLEFTPQACGLVIEDDGCGFQPDLARSGRGLKHMRQRVEELGGTLRLETGLCQTQQLRAVNPAQAQACPRDLIRLNPPAGTQAGAVQSDEFFSCTECVGTRLTFDIPLPLRFHDPSAAPAGATT
ncbi:MAG: 7TM-DISM domain-containing protein [Verrucomicrobiota bacterium]